MNGPWMDDLFLDLIVLPTGEVIEKDIEELEVALNDHLISIQDYEQAWSDFKEIITLINANQFDIFELTYKHFDELSKGVVDAEKSYLVNRIVIPVNCLDRM